MKLISLLWFTALVTIWQSLPCAILLQTITHLWSSRWKLAFISPFALRFPKNIFRFMLAICSHTRVLLVFTALRIHVDVFILSLLRFRTSSWGGWWIYTSTKYDDFKLPWRGDCQQLFYDLELLCFSQLALLFLGFNVCDKNYVCMTSNMHKLCESFSFLQFPFSLSLSLFQSWMIYLVAISLSLWYTKTWNIYRPEMFSLRLRHLHRKCKFNFSWTFPLSEEQTEWK